MAKASCFQRSSIPETNPSFYFGRSLALENALRNIAHSFFSGVNQGAGYAEKEVRIFA